VTASHLAAAGYRFCSARDSRHLKVVADSATAAILAPFLIVVAALGTPE
jgi:hypothetical protein